MVHGVTGSTKSLHQNLLNVIIGYVSYEEQLESFVDNIVAAWDFYRDWTMAGFWICEFGGYLYMIITYTD